MGEGQIIDPKSTRCRASWRERVLNLIILVSVVLLSTLAVMFLAVAVPVLALMVILVGLLANRKQADGWRPANA